MQTKEDIFSANFSNEAISVQGSNLPKSYVVLQALMYLDTLYHLDGEAVTPSPYELIDFPGIQPGSQPYVRKCCHYNRVHDITTLASCLD